MAEISLKFYLFESGCCLLTFYLFFYCFLKRETFFQANRMYLLITPFLSLLIPLLNIEIYKNSLPNELDVIFPYVLSLKILNFQILKQLNETTSGLYFSLSDAIIIIYFTGIAIMLLRLILKLRTIALMIFNGERIPGRSYVLVHTMQEMPVASFFHFLFWNRKIKDTEKEYILNHELAHIQQMHSLDNLLIEIGLILNWFNPILWLFKNDIRINHEFLADEAATKNMKFVFPYAQVMVNQSKEFKRLMLLNTFAAKIRQRLWMLNQPASSQWKTVKYIMLLPLLGGLIAFFSFDLIHPGEL